MAVRFFCPLRSVLVPSLLLCVALGHRSPTGQNALAEALWGPEGSPLYVGTDEEDYVIAWPQTEDAPRVLSDTDEDSAAGNDETKAKRESHSLSIVNPLDVLRQRLMLEMARRRMKENQEQIRENELLLKNLGKRNGRTKRNPFVRRVQDPEDSRV